MICSACETELPEQAIACWKCGTTIKAVAETAHQTVHEGKRGERKQEHDPLLIVITLGGSIALFFCVGWTIPFTVWGSIVSAGRENPELSLLFGVLSGAAFVVSTAAVILASWWGSYTVWRKMIAKPGE